MSDDDYVSDLTELDDDGDEYGTTRKNRPEDAYRIKNALKVPRATTYTAQALYEQMHSDDIKLDPEYQRDVVWPDTKMIGLIDSIYRNFYVPPIIFSVISFDDGSEKRICIDGKQRLTSIQRFMDGLIPHKDPISNEKLWYADTGGSKTRKRMLPAKYRTQFANKQIVCVEYQGITDSDEREIFQRVQLGMALTPAEKLQVTNTPRATFIRNLLAHFLSNTSSDPSPGAGSLADFDWDRARGADFRCIVQIVHCLHVFPAYPEITSPAAPAYTSSGRAIARKAGPGLAGLNALATILQLEKFLNDERPFPEAFEARVREALVTAGAMAGDKQKEVREVFRTPVKLAPVELVMVGLFVGVHNRAAGACAGKVGKESKTEKEQREAKEKVGRRKLAIGLKEMRAEVREQHVDIRMNNRVGKTMIDFIRKWKPERESDGDVSEEGEVPLAKKRRIQGKDKAKVEEVDHDGDWQMDGTPITPSLSLKFKKALPPPPPPTRTPTIPALPPPPSSTFSSSSAGPPLKSGLPPKPSHPKPTQPDRFAPLKAAKMQAQGHEPDPPWQSNAAAPGSGGASGWGDPRRSASRSGWGSSGSVR